MKQNNSKTNSSDEIVPHFDCVPPVRYADGNVNHTWQLHKITIEKFDTASRFELEGKPKCKPDLIDSVKQNALNQDGSSCDGDSEYEPVTSEIQYVALGGPYNFTFNELKENLGTSSSDGNIVLYGIGNKVTIESSASSTTSSDPSVFGFGENLGPNGEKTFHYVQVAKSVETDITKVDGPDRFYSSWPSRVLMDVKNYRECIAGERALAAGNEVINETPKFYEQMTDCQKQFALDKDQGTITGKPSADLCKPNPLYHSEEKEWLIHNIDSFGFDDVSAWKPTGSSAQDSVALRNVIDDENPTDESLFKRLEMDTFWGCYSTDVDYDSTDMTCATVELWGTDSVNKVKIDGEEHDWVSKTEDSRCKLTWLCSELPYPLNGCRHEWCSDKVSGFGLDNIVIQGHGTGDQINFDDCKQNCSTCIPCNETQSQVNDSTNHVPTASEVCCPEPTNSETTTQVADIILELEKCTSDSVISTHYARTQLTSVANGDTVVIDDYCYTIQAQFDDNGTFDHVFREVNDVNNCTCHTDCCLESGGACGYWYGEYDSCEDAGCYPCVATATETPCVGAGCDPHINTFFNETYEM